MSDVQDKTALDLAIMCTSDQRAARQLDCKLELEI